MSASKRTFPHSSSHVNSRSPGAIKRKDLQAITQKPVNQYDVKQITEWWKIHFMKIHYEQWDFLKAKQKQVKLISSLQI